MQYHPLRKAKSVKRRIVNKCALIFHRMLIYNLRLETLQMLLLLILKIQCLNQKVPRLGNHMFLTVGIFLLHCMLARRRQPYNLIAVLFWHIELIVLLYLDHLYVLNQNITFWLLSHHVVQMFLI